MGLAFAAGGALAEPPGPGVTSNLDRRVEEQAAEIVRKSVEEQLSAFEQGDHALASSQELARRLETKLASQTSDLHQQALVTAEGLKRRKEGSSDPLGPQPTGADEQIADHRSRIETGSLALEHQLPQQGHDERRHRFDRPFAKTPRVALGLRAADPPSGDRPRVTLRLLRVDPEGFDYEIRSWGSSSNVRADRASAATGMTADWVAYAGRRNVPLQAAARRSSRMER